jgi:hypothetical protein
MTDITLVDLGPGFNRGVINDNFTTVETVINDEVVHLTGGNNVMLQDFDINSNRIFNLQYAEDFSEPVTLGQLTAYAGTINGSDADLITTLTVNGFDSVGQNLRETNVEGFALWDATIAYTLGGIAKGSNGQTYQAIVANTGNDPVSDGGVNWVLWASSVTVADYAEVRALPSNKLADGTEIVITNTGHDGSYFVKTGTVTDNHGRFLVFTDDSNRYAERRIHNDTYMTNWFVLTADAGNGGKGCQRAIYAAQAEGVGTVQCPPGEIQIGDPVLPTAVYVPANVSFIGSPNFTTILSKATFQSSSGWHVISGKPDGTENYFDALGNSLNGTGDPLEARNHRIAHFELRDGIGIWFVKAREATAEYLNAGPNAFTACVFGNDATEDCANIAINNISRNFSQLPSAWFTIGLFRTNGFSINGFTQKAQSNAAAIKIDECQDGVLANVSVDQQTSLYNGVDILQGEGITVSSSCTFKNCLSAAVSFANVGGYESNNVFHHTSIDCTNHVRLYTRKNTVSGSVSIGAVNDVRLETDALLNTFIGNDFRSKTISEAAALTNLQDWIGNLGVQEGVRANLSASEYKVNTSVVGAQFLLSAVGEIRATAAAGQSLFLGANGDPLTIGMGATLFRPGADNTMDLGLAGNRWKEVFAVNGTINTSDRTEKTDFDIIPSYMLDAAQEIKQSMGVWKWISSVEAKGDAARMHIGPLAQNVYEICEKHIDLAGVDDSPFNYSFMCLDEFEDGTERWGIRPTELLFLILASM